MKSRFSYEAELVENETGGYSASFPEIPDAFTFGKDFEETIDRAAEVLQLIIAEYLDEGKPLPKAIFRKPDDVSRVVISVEVTPELVTRVKCMTVTESAAALGISKGRVCHMLDAGILQAVPYGNERLVSIASVNERKKSNTRAGRPKKQTSLVTS